MNYPAPLKGRGIFSLRIFGHTAMKHRYLLILALLTCCNFSLKLHAHGDSTLEEDPCVLTLGQDRVHLSVYQPEIAEAIEYCSSIPSVQGRTIVVLDIIEKSLRENGVGMRIYPVDEPENLLVDLLPRATIHGVVEAAFEFPAAGRYVAEVSDGGDYNNRMILEVEYTDWGGGIQTAFYNLVFMGLIGWLLVKMYSWGRRKIKFGKLEG